MTDQEKIIQLLKELKVEFEVEGNTIFIEPFYCDGAGEFGISFWDGEDYPKGEFHEFWVVPDEDKSESEEREQQPSRCDSCIHSEEQDGSNCYECVKGMADNFEAQSTDMRDATEEERKSVKDYVDSVSKPTGVNFNELLRDCGTCKHNTGIDCGQYPCNECNRRTHPLYEPKIAQSTDMTIDEAIEDCEENDYGQIADWLRELKAYKEAQPTNAVSREQALLALTGIDLPTDRDKLIALFTERIQHLPSVTPSYNSIKTELKPCDTPRTNLAETSQDCIGREETKRFLYERIDRLNDDELYDIFSRIIDDMYNELPSVTPERSKGKWIGSNGVNYTYPNSFTICSVCKCHSDNFYKYCPNCGAYMSGGGE